MSETQVVRGVEPSTADRTLEGHAGHRIGFGRHLAEMVAAMWLGMALGGVIFAPVFTALGTTASEVRVRYPEVFLLGMALVMTAPMVAWMRHRGHGWRACLEMSAAMVVPGALVLCAFWLGMTDGPACGLYCALMIVGMVVAMVFRREEYGWPERG